MRAYPAWYRRERAGEMLGTLLEASPAGRRSPSFRDARALVIGGLRVRGGAWLLSMLWVMAGIAETGYFFYSTTQPFTWADVTLGMEGWSADPAVVRIAGVLATAAWLALPIPVVVAGFVKLRGRRPRNWLRIAAWAGVWTAGLTLGYQASVWGDYPANCPAIGGSANCPAIGSPAVVSWGEMGICAAWLVLGAVMTWVLTVPARPWGVPGPYPMGEPANGTDGQSWADRNRL
jgi:hypothetical protein